MPQRIRRGELDHHLDRRRGETMQQHLELTRGHRSRNSDDEEENFDQDHDMDDGQAGPSEFFDQYVLKGELEFDTKPFKHRVLVWVGFKKVLFFPICWDWWLARISPVRYAVGCTLYVLQAVLTLLYLDSGLPGCSPASCGSYSSSHSIVQMEVILPLVIMTVFAMGYGTVVAATGWDVMRNPSGSDTSQSVLTDDDTHIDNDVDVDVEDEDCVLEDEDEIDDRAEQADATGSGGGPVAAVNGGDQPRRQCSKSPDQRNCRRKAGALRRKLGVVRGRHNNKRSHPIPARVRAPAGAVGGRRRE
ncbi:unnamed protein product, partial [Discosporangium mesarthrocarpum]